MSNPFFSFVNRFLAGAKAKSGDVNARFDEIVTAFDGVNTSLAAKSDASHNHTGVYAATAHNHDGTYAPIASPALTGTPTAPTASVDTNTAQLATTGFVVGQGYLKSAAAATAYAPIASPTHTGTLAMTGGASLVTSGQWTTDLWAKSVELANASVLRWALSTGHSWGFGVTAGSFYLLRSTANDASAAPFYAMQIHPTTHVVTFGGPVRSTAQPTVTASGSATLSSPAAFTTYFSEQIDQAANFNTTSGVFTAPVAGNYLVSLTMQARTSSGSGYAEGRLYVNGDGSLGWAPIKIAQPDGVQYYSGHCTTIVPLSQGDTLDYRLLTITGIGNTAQVNHFSIVLLN